MDALLQSVCPWQAVGIITSTFAAGFLFSVSHIATPAISEAPASLLLKQFKYVYDGGHIIGPASTIIAGACYTRVACSLPYLHTQPLSTPSCYLYGFASALTLGVVPFTFKYIGPLNYRLLALIETPSLAQPGEARTLVHQWGYYNRLRSVALLFSSVLALLGLI